LKYLSLEAMLQMVVQLMLLLLLKKVMLEVCV
jgi:hypothetical protein